MLSHMKRVINFIKPGLRQIQCSARARLDEKVDEKVVYKEGKLSPPEIQEKPPALFDGTYFRYEKWDLSIKGFRLLATKMANKYDKRDQVFDPRRRDFLGPDLAAAHFFTYRRGIVKFEGIDKPFNRQNYRHLPNSKNNSYRIESISLPYFDLYYEGLEHLKDLHNLKALSFRGVEKFDNWYLDRLSHLVPSLEFLDISFCKKVDINGLYCLYRLKNLKCLNVEGISNSVEFRLVCLSMESERRDLTILGTITQPTVKTAFD